MNKIDKRRQAKLKKRQKEVKHEAHLKQVGRLSEKTPAQRYRARLLPCFTPCIRFIEAMLTGDVLVDAKGYPLISYYFDKKVELEEAVGTINLMLEVAAQIIVFTHGPAQEFMNSYEFISRTITKRLEMGAPTFEKDAREALRVIKEAKAYIQRTDENIVMLVVKKVQVAHKKTLAQGRPVTAADLRQWMKGDEAA